MTYYFDILSTDHNLNPIVVRIPLDFIPNNIEKQELILCYEEQYGEKDNISDDISYEDFIDMFCQLLTVRLQ